MHRVVWVGFVCALVAAACVGGGADPPEDTTSTAPTPPSTVSPSTTSVPSTPESKPQGGKLDVFVGNVILGQSLNPYLFVDPFSGQNQTTQSIGRAAFGGVWFLNGDTGEFEPDLVTVLPSLDNGGLVMNDDGTLTVRYEIDPEAVWSDGEPISGADFAFTYEVVTETIARLEAAAVDDETDEEFFETCGFQQAIAVFGAEAVSAIDPDSVSAGAKSFEYTLTDPGAYDIELFRYVVPRHVVEGSDFLNDWHDRPWPSSGPFVVESHDVERSEVTLVRNDNYWRTDLDTGQALPHLDTLVLTGLDDEFLARLPDDAGEVLRGFIECRNADEALVRLGIEFGSPEHEELFNRTFVLLREVEEELFVEGLVIEQQNLDANDERVPELEAQGVEFRQLRSSFWEHITFHYGDARLRANEESLVEHVEFRRAIAHALNRARIAEEANGFPVDAIDSFVEVYSPSLAGEAWGRYDYDPDKARELLGDLCATLNRDCDADPPRLVFTYFPPRFNRAIVAELVAEMLGEVGIEVDLVERETRDMLLYVGCSGWESSVWAFAGQGFGSFDSLPETFALFDPAAPANPAAKVDPLGQNPYAWGTDAVTDAEDDPATEACDESTIYNQGPSSVRDVFTQRFDDLLRETEAVVDPAGYRAPVLEMEAILADQAVVIPLYVIPRTLAWRADVVGGYGYEIGGTPVHTWNVDEWYLVDG